MKFIHLGVFSTTIAYLLQTFAQKRVTETKTAIILSMEAVWGMVFSMLFLHEFISIRMLVGAIIILLAIIISEARLLFPKKKAP